MATVSALGGAGTTGHPNTSRVKGVYIISRSVNIADLLTAKGSAIAAADVFQVLSLPAGTQLLGGGVEVTTVGNATAATLDFGYGGAADTIADGVNIISGTGYGAAGSNGSATKSNLFTSADTLDLTVATLTGTLSTGVVRVWAILGDVASV